MNIVILSSFHTYPTSPPPSFGNSVQQTALMYTHIPCCPGTAATLDLASLDTAAVAWRYKKPHQQGALKYITHTGPWEGAIPSKQDSGLES